MLRFRISTAEYLITRNFSNTLINTKKAYANLIIANPLKKTRYADP